MNNILPSSHKQKGQAVLVVLLVMAVILTISLSVVSRSVTDIKISQQSQEAARALWVAQAGLEQAIKSNSAPTGTLNEVQYSVTRANLGGGAAYVFPEKLKANESAYFWLVPHDETTGEIMGSGFYNGTLKIYWGNQVAGAATESSPALEATIIYSDAAGDFFQKRFAYDPFAGRTPSSGFDPALAGGIVSGQTFAYSSSNIDLSSVGIGGSSFILRIRLLYNDLPQHAAVIDVSGPSQNFPSQGQCYTASARVTESGVSRKLEECRLWRIMPGIFDFTLFSGEPIS